MIPGSNKKQRWGRRWEGGGRLLGSFSIILKGLGRAVMWQLFLFPCCKYTELEEEGQPFVPSSCGNLFSNTEGKGDYGPLFSKNNLVIGPPRQLESVVLLRKTFLAKRFSLSLAREGGE